MKTEIEVIARLLQSTKTQKRNFSIVAIAEDIEWLNNHLGGLDKVADILGISEGMLRQFLSVKKIDLSVLDLVKTRKIDSVSVVSNLSKFSENDQKEMVALLLEKQITGNEIRLLSPLKKQFPTESITQLAKKLKDSKNKKIAVIAFDAQDLDKDVSTLKQDLTNITGINDLIGININGNEGFIKLTFEGEKKLREKAKAEHQSLKDFTYSILH